MTLSHLFRPFALMILLTSQGWDSQLHLRTGAATPGEELPPTESLVSEAAKLTIATKGQVINDWLSALVVTGHEREAFGWARQIADPELQSQALRTMTDTLLRAGSRDEALRVAEAAYASAQRIKPRKENLYNSLVDQRASELCKLAELLGQGGEVEKARQIAVEASNVALGMENMDQRFISLRQAVSQLADLGQPHEALAILDRIEEPAIRASIIYSALGELVAAGSSEEALQKFYDIADDRYRFHILQATVGWLIKIGKPVEAVEVAHSVADRCEQVAVMRYAATALCNAGQSEPARKILDETLALTRRITDQEERADALAGVASALAEIGEMIEARKLFAESCRLTNGKVTLGQQYEARSAIFDKLLAAGQDEEALALARLADEAEERVNDLCAVIESLVQTRQPDKARRIVAEVFAETRRVEDEAVQLSLLQNLITALDKSSLDVERKQATDAVITLLMKNGGDSDNQLVSSDTLQSLAISGQIAEALRVATRVTDTKARSFLLLNAARELGRSGRKSDAGKMLAAALDTVRKINEPMMRELQLTSLASTFIENGQVDEALNLAHRDATGSYRSQCLYLVADHLGRSSLAANRLDLWLSVLGEIEIEHEHYRSAAILSGLEMMIEAGRFDDWLILANTIECQQTRARLLCSTTEQLIKLNLKTEAEQMAEEALRVLRQMEPGYDHSQICAEFGVKLAAGHNYHLAIEFARLCAEPDDKLAIFTAILRQYEMKYSLQENIKLRSDEEKEGFLHFLRLRAPIR